jgi:CRISPR-associated endoribonuclease Cas6
MSNIRPLYSDNELFKSENAMMNLLYSIILELRCTNEALLPATTGHQAHALFLDLINQVDPMLATRLHDEPNYRPFTTSPLKGAKERDKHLLLETGKVYHLRITLLDGGSLWHCLSQRFLASPNISLQLGEATFILSRVISTPSTDATGWADYTDWQTLANTPAQHSIIIRFDSPTAFSLGDRRFALFPEPILLWDSLMRTWNHYAPECLHMDKNQIRAFVQNNVVISDYDLYTMTLRFPQSMQKGFVGICTYQIKTGAGYAPQITALAHFSRYAGVGYKTTMGMGQARM